MSIYTTATAVFDALSVPGTYTPPSGAPVAARVIVMRAVERFGAMATEAVIAQDEISFLTSELVADRGGTILVDGTTWVVMQRIRDDGAIVRWSVRPA